MKSIMPLSFAESNDNEILFTLQILSIAAREVLADLEWRVKLLLMASLATAQDTSSQYKR